MRFSKFIGRILLAILYVNAGFSQFFNQDSYIHYVNIRYPVFYGYASNLIGSYLENIEILKPNNFIQYTPNLILVLGVTQILFGFGVGLGIQQAGYCLAFLTVIITGYAHNPLIYSNQVDINREYLQIIFNIGIIGALFLIRKNKNNKNVTIKNTAESEKKEQKNAEQPKQQNNEKSNQDNAKKRKGKAL
ncbi:unnamed protein product [Paramecium primaurelia]|uniref:Uncharacterized protein n=1 Tax=Paramecium primaurelia TaxID=5886 RepID=A0A8S1MNL9_PARPR|nr:unnamed protein product [Paramecium primaurelia]